MKKLALILLAAASLVGTAGAASAQWYGGGYYGGGYYGGRPYYAISIVIDTTAMTTDIMAGDITHQAAIGLGTVANGAGQFRTASASHIAATEIHF